MVVQMIVWLKDTLVLNCSFIISISDAVNSYLKEAVSSQLTDMHSYQWNRFCPSINQVLQVIFFHLLGSIFDLWPDISPANMCKFWY